MGARLRLFTPFHPRSDQKYCRIIPLIYPSKTNISESLGFLMMGAGLCTQSKTLGASDETSLSKVFIKCKCSKVENQKRLKGSMAENVKSKREMEPPENKKKKNVTLEDCSPGFKPHSLILKRGEPSDSYKQTKKKMHPCLSQSQCPRCLLSEANDSLYLDRPLNHGCEDSSSIMISLSGKSQKRVSFKLPHHVILFSPDEPYCKEASPETYNSEDSFGSAMGPNGRGNSSFDSTEDLVVRLAVDTLPYLF